MFRFNKKVKVDLKIIEKRIKKDLDDLNLRLRLYRLENPRVYNTCDIVSIPREYVKYSIFTGTSRDTVCEYVDVIVLGHKYSDKFEEDYYYLATLDDLKNTFIYYSYHDILRKSDKKLTIK